VFSLRAIFSMMGTVISGDGLEEFEESRLRRKQGDYLSHEFYFSFSAVETWLMRRQLAYNELVVKMLSIQQEDRPTVAEIVEGLMSVGGLSPCDCTHPLRQHDPRLARNSAPSRPSREWYLSLTTRKFSIQSWKNDQRYYEHSKFDIYPLPIYRTSELSPIRRGTLVGRLHRLQATLVIHMSASQYN
jgi:hypothetical protein